MIHNTAWWLKLVLLNTNPTKISDLCAFFHDTTKLPGGPETPHVLPFLLVVLIPGVIGTHCLDVELLAPQRGPCEPCHYSRGSLLVQPLIQKLEKRGYNLGLVN